MALQSVPGGLGIPASIFVPSSVAPVKIKALRDMVGDRTAACVCMFARLRILTTGACPARRPSSSALPRASLWS